MSENSSKAPKLTPENKEKIKKFLPITAIIVTVVIVIGIFSAVFSGGVNSVIKKSTKALQEQDPKKILSFVPKDFAEEVMDYYDLDKNELNEAIEQANMLTTFNEVRKVDKVKNMKIVEKEQVKVKKLDKIKNKTAKQMIKSYFSVIEPIWDSENFKKINIATIHMSLKEDDGKKSKENFHFYSAKYKGKWYSLDCMVFLVQAAGQHVQRQKDMEEYPELFN